jgi:hypothetical protein
MEPRVKTCLFLEDAEAKEAFTSVKVLADQRTNVVKLEVDVIELSVIDLVGNPGIYIIDVIDILGCNLIPICRCTTDLRIEECLI